jgi:hypothetical protein
MHFGVLLKAKGMAGAVFRYKDLFNHYAILIGDKGI